MLNLPGVRPDHAHRTITQHCADAGIEAPDGVRYALDIDAVLVVASTPDPEADLRAGIARRDDPKKLAAALTKSAAAIAAADRVGQARTAIGRDLDMVARQALHDDADQVIAQLRPIFDETVAAARAAVDVIGPDTPDSKMLRRPHLKALWDQVGATRNRLSAIQAVRTDLADCAYGTPTEDPSWYVTTTADLEHAEPDLWALVIAGVPIRLNTAAESAAIAADRDRAEAERLALHEARKQRDADNDPMVRAYRRETERARAQAQQRAALQGPQDAA